jgi:hypothetical protein
VVVHGGCSGEINFGHCPETKIKESYIYDLTLEENRNLEKGFNLPTLNQVC